MGPTFGEVNILCTDLFASLAFYRDALGLDELEREGGAVRLRLDPVTLLLLPFASDQRPSGAYEGGWATVSFDIVVDDADATADRLVAAGGARIEQIDGSSGWAVADPDGNVIEVIRR